jgi:undecaprenyl pyrophosphate synthase
VVKGIKKEEKMKEIPRPRIGLLTATAEKKFEAAWRYAKAVRDACKTVNKDCVEPFNRAVEEFERDLNEIRELAGLDGKTELPRLKEATLEEISRFERGIIPRAVWELHREVVEKVRKVEAENDEDNDFSP